jgi:hypothetical protein
MKNKFGGLNLLSGSTVLPVDDSPSLLNVDFDISGAVQKRKGTVTVFKDTASAYPVSLDSFITQLGKQFFACKSGFELRVLDLVGDESTLIWNKTSVFRDLFLLPHAVALEDNTVLFLTKRHAPIQLRILEYEISVPTTVTSLILKVGKEWVNSYVDAVCYIDGVKTAVSKSFSVDTVTLTSVTFNENSKVYLITFNWQWWAESLIWYGDSFYQRVSRFGASDEDRHIQLPTSITADEIPSNTRYGIFAYYSEKFNELYTYKSDNQPKISLEYSFSDGSNYVPSTTAFTSPSKFYITFGEITNVNERTFTDRDVTGNQIKILKHKLKSFDIISFRNTEGAVPIGTVSGNYYYVKRITDDVIELYSDAALTTIITLSARNTKAFTDVAIDYKGIFLAITAHGFATGQPIRFTSTDTLPIPLSENNTYYAKSLTVNSFEVYFDLNLRKKVVFVNRVELYFNVAAITATNITISQHNLFDGDPIRFKTNNGTLPATVNSTTVYYVKVLTTSAIQVFYDIALTSIVPNYSGALGDLFIYVDGGTHSAIADGLTTTVERVAYDSVSLIRLRQLRFNRDTGVLPVNLQVLVDDVEATRNTLGTASVAALAYYTHSAESSTPDLTAGMQKFVSFSAKTPIGVDKDVLVTLVNTETKWCGTAALPNKFNFDNGSYVPAYGIGDYADYLNGEFPVFGALYQNRLCLCGVGSPFVVSAVYDKLIKGSPYRYFQITDDLSNQLLDPFKVRIPLDRSDNTTAVQQWQQYLFVFTNTATYRTILDSNGQFNANVNSLLLSANVGCLSKDCVVATESTLMFLSNGGVYDMSIILQNEYRASEVSVAIRPEVKKFTSAALMLYDNFNKKLFLYDGRLFVYYTDSKVWSEWGASIGWNITAMTTSANAAVFCCKALCDFQIIKTEFSKFVDFAKVFVGGSAVLVEPCLKNIPSYLGVSKYKSPVYFINDSTVEDLLVRLNLVPLRYNTDWFKLDDGFIQVVSPVNGTLYFSPVLDESFYGVVGYEDNVKMSLSDTSLGVIEPANVCTEKFTVCYALLQVNYADLTTFSITGADYTSYADLVSLGTLPVDVEPISKNDGFTFFNSFSRVNDTTLRISELRVVADTTGKPFTSWSLNIELWSTSSPIEFNRAFVRFINDGVIPFTYSLTNGNPADRTTLGILQPNGLYKGVVTVTINFNAQNEAHLTTVYNANSVPLKPTIIVVAVP